jgi:bacterioferritin (cytochrome b1)
MARIVGNEENFTEMVRNLILLENDAIAAYDSTIERLSDLDAISRIKAFCGKPLSDEQRHRDWMQTKAEPIQS